MIHTRQTKRNSNPLRKLLLVSFVIGGAMVVASGCSYFEKSRLSQPLSKIGFHQKAPVQKNDWGVVPCYGYHPTQWYPWPDWCEPPLCSEAPLVPTTELESIQPAEGEWGEVVEPDQEPANPIPPNQAPPNPPANAAPPNPIPPPMQPPMQP